MAVNMFLKLDGIKGESKHHKHKDEIDIESWSWGLSQTGSFGGGGGGGTGKVSVHDISVTKFTDKASPTLMLKCADGSHIKEGLITVAKAGGEEVEYMKIKLSDILITGVQLAGHGSDRLSENVTLQFAKVQVEYQEQGADGKAAGGPQTMGWDVKANKKA